MRGIAAIVASTGTRRAAYAKTGRSPRTHVYKSKQGGGNDGQQTTPRERSRSPLQGQDYILMKLAGLNIFRDVLLQVVNDQGFKDHIDVLLSLVGAHGQLHYQWREEFDAVANTSAQAVVEYWADRLTNTARLGDYCQIKIKFWEIISDLEYRCRQASEGHKPWPAGFVVLRATWHEAMSSAACEDPRGRRREE